MQAVGVLDIVGHFNEKENITNTNTTNTHTHTHKNKSHRSLDDLFDH